jgi:hypothetical protein
MLAVAAFENPRAIMSPASAFATGERRKKKKRAHAHSLNSGNPWQYTRGEHLLLVIVAIRPSRKQYIVASKSSLFLGELLRLKPLASTLSDLDEIDITLPSAKWHQI